MQFVDRTTVIKEPATLLKITLLHLVSDYHFSPLLLTPAFLLLPTFLLLHSAHIRYKNSIIVKTGFISVSSNTRLFISEKKSFHFLFVLLAPFFYFVLLAAEN